jgi:hypothetical protein
MQDNLKVLDLRWVISLIGQPKNVVARDECWVSDTGVLNGDSVDLEEYQCR